MATFSYRGVDKEGNPTDGVLDAETQESLVRYLYNAGVTVTRVDKEREQIPGLRFTDRFRGVNKQDVSLFTTHLATMLSSGLSLTESLSDIAAQTEFPKLKKVLDSVYRSVMQGESLSQALAAHPHVFPDVYVNMIRSGETGGVLDVVLQRLIQFYDQELDLTQRVKTAMTYPMVLVLVASGVIAFILTNFIPKFVDLFVKMGIELPLPTLILYKGSKILQKYGAVILTFMFLFIYAFRVYISTPSGKVLYDRLRLSFPIFGKLHLKTCLSRFMRTLATLYGAGVPILRSIEVSDKTMDNAILSRAMLKVIPRVREGEPLADALTRTNLFPPMVLRMVATGEKTGKLDQLLHRASDFYDSEVDNTIDRLSALLEPIILLVMGSLVGLIMASTLMPMFKMIQLIRRP